jgi:hypothetical protein
METALEVSEQREVQERRTWLGDIRPRLRQPESLFYFRLIETALEEAQDGKQGRPTDEAVLARDWIARPAPDCMDRDTYLASFTQTCDVLEISEIVLRSRLLQMIDARHEFHTRECAERLAKLIAMPLDGDEEELFAAPRVVPVRDQTSLFGLVASLPIAVAPTHRVCA